MGKKILYITSSPRKDSHSTRTADIFVEAYQQAHPDDTVERLDLWTANLPAFDGTKVIGKYAAAFGKELPEGSEERSSWDEVVKIIAHFKSFDAYVLAVPMWNFGVNYLFKQYIDVIVQPSLTFSYGPSGPAGLVTGKPVVVVTAKGGVYPDKSPIDFHVRVHAPPHTHTMLTRAVKCEQTPYLDFILKFIGFTEISYVHVEGQSDPTQAQAKQEAAAAAARALAATW